MYNYIGKYIYHYQYTLTFFSWVDYLIHHTIKFKPKFQFGYLLAIPLLCRPSNYMNILVQIYFQSLLSIIISVKFISPISLNEKFTFTDGSSDRCTVGTFGQSVSSPYGKSRRSEWGKISMKYYFRFLCQH